MLCNYDKIDHECNLNQFMAAVDKYNFISNKEKCFYELSIINQ